MQTYDFVIIGSGSAGSVVAERLSASGRFSVLVLEAGGTDQRFYVQMPLGGLTASNAAIQNRRGELKRVIYSLQTAKRTLLQSKEKAIDLIMRTIRVDREVAEEMFADNRRSAAGNGVPSREGMEQIIKSLQMLGQFTGKKIAFDEIADTRIAREVAKELGYKVD